jgi:hypothetical protein
MDQANQQIVSELRQIREALQQLAARDAKLQQDLIEALQKVATNVLAASLNICATVREK